MPSAPVPTRPPAATALVIQECQRGVIGPDSLLPLLASIKYTEDVLAGWLTAPG